MLAQSAASCAGSVLPARQPRRIDALGCQEKARPDQKHEYRITGYRSVGRRNGAWAGHGAWGHLDAPCLAVDHGAEDEKGDTATALLSLLLSGSGSAASGAAR